MEQSDMVSEASPTYIPNEHQKERMKNDIKIADQIKDLIPKPLPLLDSGSVAVGAHDDEPKWICFRNKNSRYTPQLNKAARDSNGADTQESEEDEEEEEEEEEGERPGINENVAERIPINYISYLPDDLDGDQLTEEIELQRQLSKDQLEIDKESRRQQKLKWIIYEGYKPENLQDVREYIQMICNQVPTIPQETQRLPDHFQQYLKTRLDNLPSSVDSSKILKFDSNFECGNIDMVKLASLSEYHLCLRSDTNTKGHSLWFYFSVQNTQQNQVVKFVMLNCSRPVSMIKEGFKVSVWSQSSNKSRHEEFNSLAEPTESSTEEEKEQYERMLQKKKEFDADGGWETDTFDVQCKRQVVQGFAKTFYQFSFSYKFKTNQDKVYFALFKPYPVTKLINLLRNTRKHLCEQAQTVKLLETNRDEIPTGPIEDLNSSPDKRSSPSKAQNKQNMQNKRKHLVLKERAIKLMLSNEFEAQVAKRDQEFLDKMSTPFAGTFGAQIEEKPVQIDTDWIMYRDEVMCNTLSGLPCRILTITAPRTQGRPFKQRKCIFITARVHPAETNGSFNMEGVIQKLTEETDRHSKFLRENFIFKIVPMLNPDGVIMGNHRTSLVGIDLNRRWQQPSKLLHPTIFHLKQLMERTKQTREISIFCDLHGHGKKLNSFIYGCNRAANGGFTSWTKVRLLPRVIASLTPIFSFKDCKFRIESSKLGTARVVIWNELEVTNSFTLETSLFGYSKGDNMINQFNSLAYIQLGESLIQSMAEYNYLLKELEKEYQLTNGWLKPSKLNEVTGQTAQEQLKRKMEEEKKEKQRIKRQEALNKAEEKKKKVDKKSPQKQFKRADTKKIDSPQKRQVEEQKFQLSPQKKLQRRKTTQIENPIVNTLNLRKGSSPNKGSDTLINSEDNFTLNQSNLIGLSVASRSREPLQKKATSYYSADRDDTSVTVNSADDGDTTARGSVSSRPGSTCSTKSSVFQFQSGILKRNWREFFSKQEIEDAQFMFEKGEDPNDLETISSAGSESNPSEDNYSEQEIEQNFCQALDIDSEAKVPVIKISNKLKRNGNNLSSQTGMRFNIEEIKQDFSATLNRQEVLISQGDGGPGGGEGDMEGGVDGVGMLRGKAVSSSTDLLSRNYGKVSNLQEHQQRLSRMIIVKDADPDIDDSPLFEGGQKNLLSIFQNQSHLKRVNIPSSITKGAGGGLPSVISFKKQIPVKMQEYNFKKKAILDVDNRQMSNDVDQQLAKQLVKLSVDKYMKMNKDLIMPQGVLGVGQGFSAIQGTKIGLKKQGTTSNQQRENSTPQMQKNKKRIKSDNTRNIISSHQASRGQRTQQPTLSKNSIVGQTMQLKPKQDQQQMPPPTSSTSAQPQGAQQNQVKQIIGQYLNERQSSSSQVRQSFQNHLYAGTNAVSNTATINNTQEAAQTGTVNVYQDQSLKNGAYYTPRRVQVVNGESLNGLSFNKYLINQNKSVENVQKANHQHHQQQQYQQHHISHNHSSQQPIYNEDIYQVSPQKLETNFSRSSRDAGSLQQLPVQEYTNQVGMVITSSLSGGVQGINPENFFQLRQSNQDKYRVGSGGVNHPNKPQHMPHIHSIDGDHVTPIQISSVGRVTQQVNHGQAMIKQNAEFSRNGVISNDFQQLDGFGAMQRVNQISQQNKGIQKQQKRVRQESRNILPSNQVPQQQQDKIPSQTQNSFYKNQLQSQMMPGQNVKYQLKGNTQIIHHQNFGYAKTMADPAQPQLITQGNLRYTVNPQNLSVSPEKNKVQRQVVTDLLK